MTQAAHLVSRKAIESCLPPLHRKIFNTRVCPLIMHVYVSLCTTRTYNNCLDYCCELELGLRMISRLLTYSLVYVPDSD